MQKLAVMVIVSWGCSLLAAESAASAAPVCWAVNGNYYDIITTTLSWPDARDHAGAMVYEGHLGHLATVTSAEEQAFLQATYGALMDNCWLGGYQDPTASAAADNWHWVTGEPWEYTNWRLIPWPPEPNDWGGAEFYLEVHGQADQTWNDLNDVTRPFLVEYEEEVVPAASTTWGQIKTLYR